MLEFKGFYCKYFGLIDDNINTCDGYAIASTCIMKKNVSKQQLEVLLEGTK